VDFKLNKKNKITNSEIRDILRNGWLPFRYNLLARVLNESKKIWTRTINWLQLKRYFVFRNCAHISTKRGKSVFYSDRDYYYVYRHPTRMIEESCDIVSALSPKAMVGSKIVIFPEIPQVNSISRKDLFEIIEQYSAIRAKSVHLAILITYFSNSTIRSVISISSLVLRNFEASTLIEIGLCHGDLTRDNIRCQDNSIRLIDWDDSKIYIRAYDKIYFLLMDHIYNQKLKGYLSVFFILGLDSDTFDLDEAISFIDELCEEQFAEIDYILFLLMLLVESTLISTTTKFIWSQVKNIKYKGVIYVC